jgi:hypothetical protein
MRATGTARPSRRIAPLIMCVPDVRLHSALRGRAQPPLRAAGRRASAPSCLSPRSPITTSSVSGRHATEVPSVAAHAGVDAAYAGHPVGSRGIIRSPTVCRRCTHDNILRHVVGERNSPRDGSGSHSAPIARDRVAPTARRARRSASARRPVSPQETAGAVRTRPGAIGPRPGSRRRCRAWEHSRAGGVGRSKRWRCQYEEDAGRIRDEEDAGRIRDEDALDATYIYADVLI